MNESIDIIELTKKYLGFLVTEYGFRHDESTNTLDNGYVRFRVEQLDRLEPSIEVWLKSEPKYTRIEISWIIDKYIDYKAIDKFLFEDRLAYYSKIMRKNAQELFYDLDSLLLYGLKKRFINNLKMNELITKDNFIRNIPPDIVKYFHYIKKKDRKWDLGKEL